VVASLEHRNVTTEAFMNIMHSIIVELATKGALGGSDLSRTESRLKGAEASISRLGVSLQDSVGAMSDAFTGVVEKAGTFAMHLGVAAGAAGVGAVTYGVMKLNAQLEETTISLGTIFSANGLAADMPAGMKAASDVMTKIRADAKALPGETEDLLGIFKAIAIPGARAGADINRLESLSANIMAASAVALGSGTGQMEMAAREASQLLAGRAGAHNILGSTLFGLSGDKAQEFNKKSDSDRLKFLEEGMKKYGTATAYFNESMNAQTSTLKDTAKSFLRVSTEGLFGDVKGDLTKINDYLGSAEGQEKIEAWSTEIGMRLQYAYAVGREEILKWGPPLFAFAEQAQTRILSIWERVEPIVARVDTHLQHAFANGDAFKDVEKTLEAYAALKVAKPALSMGMSAASMFGGGGGGMGAMLGGEGLAAGAATGGIALAALATAAAAVYGAFDNLDDSTSVYHTAQVGLTEELKGNVTRTWESLEETVSNIKPVLKDASDALGFFSTALADSTSGMTRDVGNYLEWLSKNSDKIPGLVQLLGEAVRTASNTILNGQGFDEPDRTQELHFSRALPSGGKSINDQLKELYAKQAAAKGPAGTGTHIQKVEIVVSSNADPSRVAQIVMSHIVNLARNPKQSPDSPNYSAVR
jgi:hypothetical protein